MRPIRHLAVLTSTLLLVAAAPLQEMVPIDVPGSHPDSRFVEYCREQCHLDRTLAPREHKQDPKCIGHVPLPGCGEKKHRPFTDYDLREGEFRVPLSDVRLQCRCEIPDQTDPVKQFADLEISLNAILGYRNRGIYHYLHFPGTGFLKSCSPGGPTDRNGLSIDLGGANELTLNLICLREVDHLATLGPGKNSYQIVQLDLAEILEYKKADNGTWGLFTNDAIEVEILQDGYGLSMGPRRSDPPK